MRIEAIVPSVGFGDYLWDTLPRNLPHVDDLVVVTSKEDTESQSAAVRHGARLITTDAHRRGDSPYDKGAAINAGLAYLRRDAWLLLLDADIVMPPTARRLVEAAGPDPSCIYGVDRVDCPGWIQYAAWLTDCRSDPTEAIWMSPRPGWKVGGRISLAAHAGGWHPCGFWSLWHSSQWDSYPEAPGCDAGGGDMLHAARWPRSRRVLLPDWYALHLISARAPLGADWAGRTTPRWGPPAMARPAAAAAPGPRPGPTVQVGPEQAAAPNGPV